MRFLSSSVLRVPNARPAARLLLNFRFHVQLRGVTTNKQHSTKPREKEKDGGAIATPGFPAVALWLRAKIYTAEATWQPTGHSGTPPFHGRAGRNSNTSTRWPVRISSAVSKLRQISRVK